MDTSATTLSDDPVRRSMRRSMLLSEHDWSGTWVTTLLWLHELQETTWRLNS
jgi:hypothetical protein